MEQTTIDMTQTSQKRRRAPWQLVERMDRDLVIRAQAGDVEAFSALTVARTGPSFATAKLILRDDELARDAVQDALLEAWIHLRALRDPDRF